MVESIKVTANKCTCEAPDHPECNHVWLSLAKLPPAFCPVCRSRQWNGVKIVGRPAGRRDTSKQGLPKPHRVRSNDAY